MKEKAAVEEIQKALDAGHTALYEIDIDAIRTLLAERTKLRESYQVFKDGDAWCAVGPGFINIQKSLCVFDHNPIIALTKLRELEPKEF